MLTLCWPTLCSVPALAGVGREGWGGAWRARGVLLLRLRRVGAAWWGRPLGLEIPFQLTWEGLCRRLGWAGTGEFEVDWWVHG